MTGITGSVQAGDFAFQNNQISWFNGPTVTATIRSNGVAPQVDLPLNGQAASLPNVSFVLEDLGSATGTTDLRVFVEVKNRDDADEIEMRMGVIRVTTTAGGVADVEMVPFRASLRMPALSKARSFWWMNSSQNKW